MGCTCIRRHENKADGEICLKKMFNKEGLCYSVEEADRRFNRELPRIFSTGANGRNKPQKQGFNNGWRDIPTEELQTNMCSIREVDLVGKLFTGLKNDYGLGNQFTEVVHGKLSKDFLENELHLF